MADYHAALKECNMYLFTLCGEMGKRLKGNWPQQLKCLDLCYSAQ